MGSAISFSCLQDLYAVFPAFLQKFFRQFPVRDNNVNIGKSAKTETAFNINFGRIHQGDHLIGLSDRGLL